MIDFIKTEILTTPEYLFNHTDLEFSLKVNNKTGEVIQNSKGFITHIAEVGQLKIQITQNNDTNYSKIELSGSVHKHQQQGTNYKDYTFIDVVTTINQICDLLKLPPDKFIIRHIEYGLNIATKHSAKDILNSIIAYNGIGYEIRKYNGLGYLKRFGLSQYDLKVYDKSKQYGLSNNILRFELKVCKMQYFKTKGIHLNTLADLLNNTLYYSLFRTLHKCFEGLYLFDYRICLNAIKTVREQLILTECINTNYWKQYRDTHSAKGYTKKVNRFKDLVKKYAPDNLKLYLKTEIQNKWFELLNSTPILPPAKNSNVPQFYPLIVGNINPDSKRYCLTCGKDISHQKNSSLFCSEKLNGPEGKKCRNKLSNLKRDEKRKYPNPTLFDIDKYLRAEYKPLKNIINQQV